MKNKKNIKVWRTLGQIIGKILFSSNKIKVKKSSKDEENQKKIGILCFLIFDHFY